jgi:hypothetical protein
VGNLINRFQRTVLIAGCLSLLLPACTRTAQESPGSLPTRFAAAERIVAIGDLHGDLAASRRALKIAGAIDDEDHWIGGRLVLVQTGDQLDRGGDELEILDLLEQLALEAARAGGAVHVLNGNHELMNAYLDLRYVTEEGFEDFTARFPVVEPDSLLLTFEPAERSRAAAFRPGGPVALRLARRNTAVIIGENLFVHGGILPGHVDLGLEVMNETIRSWLRGEGPCPEWIRGSDSPVWSRHYSSEVDAADAELLDEVLERLDVRRMIVGHTVQQGGIAAYCDGRVWCIDTGMSRHYGGEPRVLEIRGDVIRVLR